MSGASRKQRVAGPALAALIVACCLAAPVIAGAVGALTAGALVGIGAGVLALLGLCLLLVRRVASERRC